MKSRLSIRDRMIRSVTMRRGEVVLRSDFEQMGSQSQISRIFSDFVKEERLVRLGYGVFAKARISSLTGKPVPLVNRLKFLQRKHSGVFISMHNRVRHNVIMLPQRALRFRSSQPSIRVVVESAAS